MKAKPYKLENGSYIPCDSINATYIMLNLPGPIPTRILPVITHGSRSGTNCWSWNGDTEKPTIKPSILSNSGTNRCHTWINDGKVIFLDDCSHELKGQTLDLLDIEE